LTSMSLQHKHNMTQKALYSNTFIFKYRREPDTCQHEHTGTGFLTIEES
jgi:hypothetical protein